MLSHETTCASAGDENFVRRRVNRSYDKKQLTPRQGTKTPRRPCRTQHPSETTYTPPGDENRVGLVPIQDLCEITYIPPGDENLVAPILSDASSWKQLTPRQGTKKAPYPCG